MTELGISSPLTVTAKRHVLTFELKISKIDFHLLDRLINSIFLLHFVLVQLMISVYYY